MTVRELAEEILRSIENGTLDPEATVVRPRCMCDYEHGFIEAQYIDQVVRRLSPAQNDPDRRVFGYGNVSPGENTVATVKLG